MMLGLDMAFRLKINTQLLGLDVVFRAHIDNIDAAAGKLAQDVHQDAHPVIQRFGDQGGGVIAGHRGQGVSEDRVSGAVVRGHFALDDAQAVGSRGSRHCR